MKKIALIGSKKLAAQLIHYINSVSNMEVIGLFDDFEPKGTLKHGCPILGSTDVVHKLYKDSVFDGVIVAVGYNHRKFRSEICHYLDENKIPLETFIHPSALIDKTAVIGKGSVILMNTIIDMDCTIEENVFISSGCIISHNVKIGAHCYLAPGVIIAGDSSMGTCSFLGLGTRCIDNIEIGSNVFSAAGSVITNNIPDNVMVMGVPAKIRKNEECS